MAARKFIISKRNLVLDGTRHKVSLGRRVILKLTTANYGTLSIFKLFIFPQIWYLQSMPRQSRIDAPGALHHIIARGIGRRNIFDDDHDRDKFLNRLETIIVQTQTCCFAWAPIPNHFLFLLRTGDAPGEGRGRYILKSY